jgi:hypothetical protein
MAEVIHKAARPKEHYANPTLCIAPLEPKEAHASSRINWDRVTCKKCLRLRSLSRAEREKLWDKWGCL